MLNVYLDPFLFACPSPSSGPKEFEQYILNLLAWRKLRTADWPPVFIKANTTETLFKTNSYPLWNDLKNVISCLGISDIQPRDIVDVVNGLLQKVPSLEDRIGIVDLLAVPSEINPSEHLQRRSQLFVDEYQNLLMLICLTCQLEGLEDEAQIVATRYVETDVVNVSVAGEIDMVEFGARPRELVLPLAVNGTFPNCSKPDGFYCCVNPVSLWTNANSEQAYRLSLELQLNQLYGLTIEDIGGLSWSFGSSFLETAQAHGFMNEANKAKMLLRSCAETVLGLNLSDTHALREGRGPRSPQRKRGEDRAWRRDIDYEYHLHYWSTSKGPEMASVVIHNDMTIAE